MPETIGRAVIHTSLDRDHDAVFARGVFGALFDGYLTHAKGLGPLPDEPSLRLMQQSLACALLHLALQPPDLFCAFTLNFLEPPRNLFLAGDNSERQITGRVYSENVRTAARSRLYVESQRPKQEPTRTLLDFDGQDILPLFEHFYSASVQAYARLFPLGDGEFMLAQGLPRVNRAWLEAQDSASIRAHLESGLERIEEREYQFRCGCDAHRILKVMRGLFRARVNELFGGLSQVEVSCPRCGKSWLIQREEFEDSKLGFS